MLQRKRQGIMTRRDAANRSRWRVCFLPAAFLLFQVGVVLVSVGRLLDSASGTLPPPLWDGCVALLWGLAAAAVVIRVWRGAGARQTVLLFSGFSIYSLFRLFIFSQADYDRGRLPFLTLSIALCVITALLWSRYTNRMMNGVSSHDREPQD